MAKNDASIEANLSRCRNQWDVVAFLYAALRIAATASGDRKTIARCSAHHELSFRYVERNGAIRRGPQHLSPGRQRLRKASYDSLHIGERFNGFKERRAMPRLLLTRLI